MSLNLHAKNTCQVQFSAYLLNSDKAASVISRLSFFFLIRKFVFIMTRNFLLIKRVSLDTILDFDQHQIGGEWCEENSNEMLNYNVEKWQYVRLIVIHIDSFRVIIVGFTHVGCDRRSYSIILALNSIIEIATLHYIRIPIWGPFQCCGRYV